MNAVWAVGDARPYCLVSLKTLHVYLLTILKQFTPPQSPNGDSFLVCRLGQIAKRLPPAICDPDVPSRVAPVWATEHTNKRIAPPTPSKFYEHHRRAASVPPDQSVGSPPCGRPTIRTNINKSRETTKWENQNNFNELIRRTSHGASGTPPPTIK